MVLICIIPQVSSTEKSGSTDPAFFCLCVYTLVTLPLYCSSVLAVSVWVLYWVSCYCEWIFNEAMASSTAVLLGSEPVENSLSLSQPSVGISEGGLKSQAALPLSSIPVHSTLHGNESHSLTARPNCRWWKQHHTSCTVMLIPQLNYTPKQPSHW